MTTHIHTSHYDPAVKRVLIHSQEQESHTVFCCHLIGKWLQYSSHSQITDTNTLLGQHAAVHLFVPTSTSLSPILSLFLPILVNDGMTFCSYLLSLCFPSLHMLFIVSVCVLNVCTSVYVCVCVLFLLLSLCYLLC